MKKAITIALIAVLSIGTLFASGTTETASADGKTKIVWAAWDVQTTPYYEAIVNAYETKNPDVDVEMLDLGSADYSTMLQTQLSGGDDSIDVVAIKDIPGYNNHVKANLLSDLTPFIEADGVDLAQYGGIAEQITVNGKLYALPFRSDFWVIFYNKALFDAAGVPYPDNDMTFEEYDALARRMTSGTGSAKVYGAHYHTWRSAVQLFGILDGEHTAIADNYEFERPYYEMVLSQQRDGIVMDYGSLKTSGTHYSGVFYNEQVAMMNMGSWFIATQIAAINSGESQATEWGIVKYPHAEGVEPGSTLATITSLGVSAGSKNQEAAWDFVKYVSSAECAEVIATTGTFPAVTNDKVVEIIKATPGFPQDDASAEALNVSHAYLEMPLNDRAAEIEVVLNQNHDAIMTYSISLDEGLARMAEQVSRYL